jgi:hypothetical protein
VLESTSRHALPALLAKEYISRGYRACVWS